MNDVNLNDENPATLFDSLASVSIAIAGCAMVGLVLVQGWQVFARYVLNSSPSWSEPVTVVLLSTCMSFAAAASVHGGNHFAFSLLVERSSGMRQRLMRALTHLIVISIGSAIAVGATRLFIDGLDIRMAGAAMPQSTALAPLAVGGALMTLFAWRHLWRTFASPSAGAAR